MGGTAPGGTELNGGPEPPGPDPRRLARVQMALGVPAVFVVLLGVVVAFRLAGRPVDAALMAAFLAPVLVVFTGYYILAWRRLRRPPGPAPGTKEETDGGTQRRGDLSGQPPDPARPGDPAG